VSPSPDLDSGLAGLQLRGMATDPAVRGTGVGAMLLSAGIERARRAGVDHVWANARSSVLDFYTRHGFDITSDEFESAETAIAHRRILLRF
jgi:GNAT superfamily N-acetyltransferase